MNMQIRRHSRIAALIAEHKAAIALSEILWDRVCDIDNANHIPTPRVKVGTFNKGKDADGNDIREPIFAYHEEPIVERVERDRETLLMIQGRNEYARSRINRNYDRFASEKLEQLRTLKANERLAQDACGYTAAYQAAKAQSDRATAIIDEIVQAHISTLADFRLAAGYLAELRHRDEVDEDKILDFLTLASNAVRPTLEAVA